jgi:ech hydrogenase subunit A
MILFLFLFGFPLLIALVLAGVKRDAVRGAVVKTAAVILSTAALLLLALNLGREANYLKLNVPWATYVMMVVEGGLAAYVLYLCARHRKPLIFVLVLVQAVPVLLFEALWGRAIPVQHNLFFDKFSAIMGVIVGVLGSLIAVYSLGYMREYHEKEHRELKDRRRSYFFIIFVFLSAMFGLVFTNDLLWLFFFWGITTLCSFFLIGYDRKPEAMHNAFLALLLNVIGEIGFAGALYYLYFAHGTVELDGMLALGKAGALLPAALLSLAGMTKSAQMPFASWLLGAMVAPTPVSALLHSSTMVKAGVYIVVRVAPLLQGTLVGLLVALVGGVTFLLTSFIAISQSNAKRVLAYSTIGNLGLVMLCAGIGTYEAVWAAILLIIFHAVAKCLLFLSVGVVEPAVGGRDIELMGGLLLKMPGLTVIMLIGIAGMFLAPFGMLISKVAVLKALADSNPVLTGLVAFGSGTTVFFWVKWMGKLVSVANPQEYGRPSSAAVQRNVLWIIAGLTVAVALLFPLISRLLVDPYLLATYGQAAMMSRGNLIIMAIMLVLVMLFPLSFLLPGRRARYVEPYMGGANRGGGDFFRGSMGVVQGLAFRNYYLTQYFRENTLFLVGSIIAAVLIAGTLAAGLLAGSVLAGGGLLGGACLGGGL